MVLFQGDVSETIAQYFKDNKRVKPRAQSALTMQEVSEGWLRGF